MEAQNEQLRRPRQATIQCGAWWAGHNVVNPPEGGIAPQYEQRKLSMTG